jgi:HAMP domain-containing protein
MKAKASTNSTHQKSKKRNVKRKRVGLVFVAVLIAIVGVTLAFSKSTSQARSGQGQQKRYIATREVTLDQTTGQRRKPTDEEIEALVAQVSALTNRSSEGLTVTKRPDGTQMMDLQDRFNNVALARANEDGTTSVRCVTSMEEAAEFLGLQEVITQDQ